MIKKIMKAVKSGNKKRGRNITIGAVVGLLLLCTAVMGAEEIELEIGNYGNGIEFKKYGNKFDPNVKESNPYSENEWEESTKTYTNNSIILGNKNKVVILKLIGDLGEFNLINNGFIRGIGEEGNYGIYNKGTIEALTNNGVITLKGNLNVTNGIFAIWNEETIKGSLTNNGLINIDSTEIAHNHGIVVNGPIEGDIINNGLIIVETNSYSRTADGKGIYVFNDVGSVINNGLIIVEINDYSSLLNRSEACGIEIRGNSMRINTGLITVKNEKYKSYGIYNEGSSVVNKGLIKAKGKVSTGIVSYNYMSNKEYMTILNDGLISSNSGIQIANELRGVVNRGLVMGMGTSTNINEAAGIAGFALDKENHNIGTITNLGVIYGTKAAVSINSKGTIEALKNYGILATAENSIINKEGKITNTPENYGLYISEADGKVSFDNTKQSNNSIEIFVGYDDSRNEIKRNMTIKNAPITGNLASGVGTSTDSFTFSGNSTEFDNSILNGKDKTLKISGADRKVIGSIINAYGTAVAFEGRDNQLTLSGTIVSGGIDGSSSITGSSNRDELILQSKEIEYVDRSKGNQETIINGNINLGAGNDTLTIANGTIINGNVDMEDDDDIVTLETGSTVNGTLAGGKGNDTLNFNQAVTGASRNNEINIQHNISGFENMNINTNVTLFEKTSSDDGSITDLKVTGADNITIGADGVLTLRLDITNIDNASGTDKIIGHAFYKNNGKIISTDGGKFLLALNGAGNGSVINFGDTTLDGSLVTAHEAKNEGEINFATTSVLHLVKRIEGTTNEVIITPKADLPIKPTAPDNLAYEKLNEIYQGIISVDELGNFNVDDDEKLSTFLGYLNDIYAGNPYSYSSELSRKSAGMFRDIVTENIFKPKTNKWMIYGGLTHIDGGTKDTYYGKGYYTYDIGSSDIDADTKITGAYMLGEYGVSDTLTSGIVIGGNKLKSNLSNGSKLDGDSLYLGAYAKKYVGNLKVTAGAGFQYGDYDADRIAVNKVASSIGTPVIKYSDNYNDITYDIYLSGRYSHNIGDNLFLEPYGTLSYTYIDQDGANEGSKTLAIETDSKSFDYTSAKVGVDLKKVIPHEKGKSTLSAGVSYTKILDGADEEHITGRFKGGSDFDILVAHKNEHSIGVNAKYALELENGVLFDVKGTYTVERDSHNNSGKNKTKGEWIVGAGLGYKF